MESHPFLSIAPNRRAFLKAAAAFGACAGASFAQSASEKSFAYVGTYTGPGGNGKGIYLFEMDHANGKLELISLAAAAESPSWLTLAPSGRFLYAANEVANGPGGSGFVSAYAVDRSTGGLMLLNKVSSMGAGPAYIGVDGSGKYLFVANYAGGSIAVLRIEAGGQLGAVTFSRTDAGSLGKTVPTNAPDGSFAFSGHDAPHAHMIQAAPGNHFVLQTDLGQDRIYVYAFDQATGSMRPRASSAFTSLPSGDGPRHFAFHPNGHWLYSIQEEASTIVFFHFDPATGNLAPQTTVSTLPDGFKGTSFTSEIAVSADGRFLYAANRLADSIAVFAVEADGRLRRIGDTPTFGDYPSYFTFDPSGRFLYVCNHRSDNITCFRAQTKSGLLEFTGAYTAIGTPGSIVFLRG